MTPATPIITGNFSGLLRDARVNRAHLKLCKLAKYRPLGLFVPTNFLVHL